VGNILVLGAVAVALFLFRTGHSTGERRSQVTEQLAEMGRRLDAAGKRMSDLASMIQALPGTTSLMKRELELLQRELDKLVQSFGDMRERLTRVETRQENGDH
jgi:septal ring factor EnvC (AmiA/AmiB activator)